MTRFAPKAGGWDFDENQHFSHSQGKIPRNHKSPLSSTLTPGKALTGGSELCWQSQTSRTSGRKRKATSGEQEFQSQQLTGTKATAVWQEQGQLSPRAWAQEGRMGTQPSPHLVLRVPGADEQQLQRAQVAQALARRAHDLVQEGLAQLGEHTAVVEHPAEGQGSASRALPHCGAGLGQNVPRASATARNPSFCFVSSWETLQQGKWVQALGSNKQIC